MSDPRIIVALDYPNADSALALADQLSASDCRLKVGKELFTRSGPAIVTALHQRGFDVFLDLKYHDIPHTVARACAAAAELGVWMVNVHTLGGPAMLKAARQALDFADAPLLIGVTLLTSMDANTFHHIGLHGDMQGTVSKLAEMAADNGLDGVVCSAQETALLRQQQGDQFALVTPGIRPAGSQTDDQHRIMTPAAAINAGSHYLVIGRPITQAANPQAALAQINQSLL
ncbi:Orotidine 5'-phosphate decarboxylase [Methylophaga frappieri]|uniref:Orotidine 5'-phosphate decarboxylase n=1 Tax=Methylophaga frappieri (strain ATCC BAA-2434 / DSM 25690 / JAM7) TaxID=754477 RepID=I1YKQ1_METFJ|nr:orotidine-5'-phosphate decarboxylase [Methylophaga frappieri]AFJ03494.1 Orotidine 5'-phosphate decarboxylase [Methylophaga frappieri]